MSSTSVDNRDIARKTKKALKRHGYYVFDPTQLIPNGDDFWDQYDEQLEIAADRGFVLFMLNLKSLRSRWSQREIEIALEKASSGGSVIILNMEPLKEFACRMGTPGVYLD